MLQYVVLYWLILALTVGFTCSATKLLLVADSISRHFVEEWCLAKRSNMYYVDQYRHVNDTVKPFHGWGNFSINYEIHSPVYCIDSVSRDVVAQVQIFGANATGPYYSSSLKDWSTLPRIVDTVPRIAQAAVDFEKTFGTPDRVILHSAVWDAIGTFDTKVLDQNSKDTHPAWAGIVAKFKANTIERLEQLEDIYTGKNVDIGLITGCWVAAVGDLMHSYNKVLREIAASRNLTIYDFNNDVWSKVNFDASKTDRIQRDWLHPNYKFSYSAGEIMLGKQHSSFYTYKGQHASHHSLHSLAGYENVNFRLIRRHTSHTNSSSSVSDTKSTGTRHLPGVGEIFYSEIINGTRYKFHIGNTSSVLHSTGDGGATSTPESNNAYNDLMVQVFEDLLMGPSDMMLLPAHTIDEIKTATEPMPVLFSATKNIGFTSQNLTNSSHMDMYVTLYYGGLRPVPWFEAFEAYSVAAGDIIHNVSRKWFELAPFDTWLKENALVRYHSEQTVYVIKNNTKYSFNTAADFTSLGYNFDAIRTIGKEDKLFFDLIPDKGPIK